MTKKITKQKTEEKKKSYSEVIKIVRRIQKKLEVFNSKNPSSQNERLLQYR